MATRRAMLRPARRPLQEDGMPPTTDTRTCPTCGEEFAPRGGSGGLTQVYCRRTCQAKAYRASHPRVPVPKPAQCVECSGPLTQPTGSGRPRRFCSDPCRFAYHDPRRAEDRNQEVTSRANP